MAFNPSEVNSFLPTASTPILIPTQKQGQPAAPPPAPVFRPPVFNPSTQLPPSVNPLVAGPPAAPGATFGNSKPAAKALLGMLAKSQASESPFSLEIGEAQPVAARGSSCPWDGGTDFISRLLQMQFSNLGFLGGADQLASGSGGDPKIQSLAQQLHQVYAQMQDSEGQQAQISLDRYNSLKESVFASFHYEPAGDGRLRLVLGPEPPEERAERLQYENHRSTARQEQFSQSPANGQIQSLNRHIRQASQAGLPVKALCLQLEQLQTQFNLMKAQAHLEAQGPPVRPDQSPAANEMAAEVARVGSCALQEYASLHASNMEQLANNPLVDLYLNAMASRTQAIQADQQQHMTEVTQEMKGPPGPPHNPLAGR